MNGGRRMRRRGVLAAMMAAASTIVLAACAGLPSSGPVQQGLPAEDDTAPPDLSFIPDRPQPGATPEQIVDGFLRAGSGPADGWARAREFLAPDTPWNPNAGVTVDITGEREVTVVDDDTVTVSLETVANVDDRGAYERSDGGTTLLPFELTQQDDGEWRISAAPDGVVLDRDVFPSVYHAYPLMYFDTTWTYLVPDVRWFPTTNTATRIADTLVNELPSEWLADSILNAFPEGVSAAPAVPVSAGVATVTLSDSAREVDQEALDRMLTQLEASFVAAGVSSVEMFAGATPLAAEPVTVRRTTVTGPPLVSVAEGFGFLTGNDLAPIPGLSEAMAAVEPLAVQVAPERDVAAVRVVGGSVLRVPAEGDITTVDTRPELVDPSIDPAGTVWSVPRAEPQALRAQLSDGRVIDVADAWPGAGQITAMSLSRDGTRIAALVTSGVRSAVWVAGVVVADGAPVRLGAPVELSAVVGTGIDLAWLDDTTLGVLSRDGETAVVLEQIVGGPGSGAPGPEEADSIAGASSVTSVRLHAADGRLYIKRGTNWQATASDVLVLATQQGMPENAGSSPGS